MITKPDWSKAPKSAEYFVPEGFGHCACWGREVDGKPLVSVYAGKESWFDEPASYRNRPCYQRIYRPKEPIQPAQPAKFLSWLPL